MAGKLPKRLDGVGVDEKLEQYVPLDIAFHDDKGRKVTIGDMLADNKPIILSLNYSDCPGLCITQLNGLTEGINNVTSLKLGTDFKMISLSIDPRESVDKAAATKARYTRVLEERHSMDGWSFWIGSEADIAKVADSVGFRYTYDAKHNQYNHSAAAIFLSPKGKITRYLYEVGFIRGETLRMALIEAGEGRIGSSFDAFVLWCSHYDASENRYSASARTVLSVTAGGFVFIGLVALVPYWLTRLKRQTLRDEQEGQDDSNESDASSQTSGHRDNSSPA